MLSKTILIPFDFSKASIKALQIALKLAKKIDAKLILLNAFQTKIPVAENILSKESQSFMKQAEDNALKEFEVLKKEIKALNEVENSFVIKHEFPEDAIISMTSIQQIDLIVIGITEANRIKRALLSSHTQVIAKNAKSPILIIPEGAETSKIFKNIGLAGDYKKSATKETFEILIQIASAYNSDIHVLHVSKLPVINSDEKVAAQKLDRYFKDLNHSFFFKLDQDIDKGIDEHMERYDIDLLALVENSESSIEHIFKITDEINKSHLFKVPFLILHAN